MKIKITKKIIYNIILVVAIFWFADFLMHIHGVGESNYYYILKFGNATLLAFIWFTIFDNKEHYKKALFANTAGTKTFYQTT